MADEEEEDEEDGEEGDWGEEDDEEDEDDDQEDQSPGWLEVLAPAATASLKRQSTSAADHPRALKRSALLQNVETCDTPQLHREFLHMMQTKCCEKSKGDNKREHCLVCAFTTQEAGGEDFKYNDAFNVYQFYRLRRLNKTVLEKKTCARDELRAANAQSFNEAARKAAAEEMFSWPTTNYAVIHDGKTTVLCRESIACLYDVTNNFLKTETTSMRRGDPPGNLSRGRAWNTQTYPKVSAKKFSNMVTTIAKLSCPGEFGMQISQVRSSPAEMNCAAWMQHHFNQWEFQPNQASIHMGIDKQKRIHSQYLSETFTVGDAAGQLDYSAFLSLWKKAFPHVKVNRVQRVSGKCWTCAEIDKVRWCKEFFHLMYLCRVFASVSSELIKLLF